MGFLTNFRQLFALLPPADSFLWLYVCLKSWQPMFSQKNQNVLNNFRIIWLKIGTFTIFSHFMGKFFPHSLQLLVLWSFLCLESWNPDILVSETKKYAEILNNIWIITFYIRILAIFGNFWSTFCIIHSSCWFCDHFFAWNN